MSSAGAPKSNAADYSNLKVTIVAALWHEEVMDGLLAGATRFCAEINIEPLIIRVPGAFELPVAVAHAARSADAVVALGVVIRGGTPHFEYVCSAATDGLTRASLDSGVPVGFGVLTCDTDEQARDRAGFADSSEDKGREATHAALATAATLKELADATRGSGLGFGK